MRPDLGNVRRSALDGEALTRDQLRAWAQARRHYDATREQAAVGSAVIDLLDRVAELEAAA